MPIDRHSRAYKTKRDAVKKRWAAEQRECHICNGAKGPIDYLTTGTALSCDLDHITAVARGGSVMDISNWAPSHATCNRSKGDGNKPQPQRPAGTRRTTYWGTMDPPSETSNVPPFKWR
ncbi:HNH endonuclease [Kocuria sabuli]|uniref:HNH endonuclease n=1 Tax=Kocuria sabuli TaxID=3071448 RepID=UPI0034D49822